MQPFVGRELDLQPVYGWGWTPSFPWQDGPRDVFPPRSRIRLLGLFEWRDACVGGVAEVLAVAGPPDWTGSSVWFHLRQTGTCDLDDRLGHYDLAIRRAPPYSVERIDEGWDSYDWYGYAMIGAPGWDHDAWVHRECGNRPPG